MPYAIVSSQASITRRPQTTKAARRAFNKRKSFAPSEKDLKRFAREEKQERLAAEKKRREQKRKENEKRRADEREEEKQKIKTLGVEEVVKVEEGQMRIAGFFKTAAGKGLKNEDSKKTDSRERSPEEEKDHTEACAAMPLKPNSPAPSPQQPKTPYAGIQSPSQQRASRKRPGSADLSNITFAKIATDSVPDKPDCDRRLAEPEHQLPTERPKPLSEISANVQKHQMAPPQLSKRKSSFSELDDCWADFLTSGTQIARELALPCVIKSPKRQCFIGCRDSGRLDSPPSKDLVSSFQTRDTSNLSTDNVLDARGLVVVRKQAQEPMQTSQQIDKVDRDSDRALTSSDKIQYRSNSLLQSEAAELIPIPQHQTQGADVLHFETDDLSELQHGVPITDTNDLDEDDELDNFLLGLISTQELSADLAPPVSTPEDHTRSTCEKGQPAKQEDDTGDLRSAGPDPTSTSFDMYDDFEISSQELAALVP